MKRIVIPVPIPLSIALCVPIVRQRRSFGARAATACSRAVCARANGAPSAVTDVRASRVIRARRDREVAS